MTSLAIEELEDSKKGSISVKYADDGFSHFVVKPDFTKIDRIISVNGKETNLTSMEFLKAAEVGREYKIIFIQDSTKYECSYKHKL